MALLVFGGRRLRKVAFLPGDSLVRRFSGLRVVLTARTLSRRLQGFTMRTVARVQGLNAVVVTQMLTTPNQATLSIDLATGAAARPRTRKRTVLHALQRIQTPRFVLLQRTGLLVGPAGTMRLRLAANPANACPLQADRRGSRQSGANN